MPMKPKENRAGDPTQSLTMDCCGTPPNAVVPLVPFLNPSWTIWECAMGEGLLFGALVDHGFTVTGSDILQGNNFLYDESPHAFDCIVTNPPYSIKKDWVRRCLEYNKPFALLMPLETIGAQWCASLIKPYDIQVLLLDRRINFKMPNKGWAGSAQFPVCWVCRGLNMGQLEVGHVPTWTPIPETQLVMELAA